MVKSDRFKTVSKVAEERERKAVSDMGVAQHVLAQRQQRLKELQAYRDEYNRRFSDGEHASRPVVLINDFRLFMHRLDQAVNAQQKMVDAALAEYQAKHAVWMTLHSKAKAIGKVVDKLKVEERRSADRKEQKANDEHAGRDKSTKS